MMKWSSPRRGWERGGGGINGQQAELCQERAWKKAGKTLTVALLSGVGKAIGGRGGKEAEEWSYIGVVRHIWSRQGVERESGIAKGTEAYVGRAGKEKG